MGACRLDTGKPKRRWTTRAEAKGALRRYITEGLDMDGLRPYRCPVCEYFHLGHYPDNPRIREAYRRRHQGTS